VDLNFEQENIDLRARLKRAKLEIKKLNKIQKCVKAHSLALLQPSVISPPPLNLLTQAREKECNVLRTLRR